MTIASEIQRIQEGIKDVYDAAETKGAILPATKNSANLATCINSITKYGKYNELASYKVIDGVIQRTSITLDGTEFEDITSVYYAAFNYAFYNCRHVTGKFSMPNLTTITQAGVFSNTFYCGGLSEIDLSGLITINGNSIFEQTFYYCPELTTVDMSSLTTITGDYICRNMFAGCSNLTNIDLSSLTTITGRGAFNYTFAGCSNLTNINLSSLTTLLDSTTLEGIFRRAFANCTSLTNINLSALQNVTRSGFAETFYYCTALTSISFPALTTLDSSAFDQTFYGCFAIADIYFPALTTSSFSSQNLLHTMMKYTGSTITHTIHFPSNLQLTVRNLRGYPTFGGTSGYITIAYDLPATS